MDQTLSQTCGNETISQTLQHRFNNDLLSPEMNQCNRLVFEVSLTKTSQHGIGITIVGGDSIHKHGYGIYVKSVTVNGPAHADGQIKPGDQIIAINDQSLEGIQHHESVTMIKNSSDRVKLLIAQVKPPGSLDRSDVHRVDSNLSSDTQNSLDHNQPSESSKLVNTRASFTEDSHKPISVTMAEPVSAVNTANVISYAVDTKSEKDDDKKSEKGRKKDEKKSVSKGSSIPEGLTEVVDPESRNSATVDVHSTLSQVDSLHSEVEASDIPTDHKPGRSFILTSCLKVQSCKLFS